MQIKTTDYRCTPVEWLLSKTEEIVRVDKDMEEREPLCTVGGDVNWYSHYGKQYGNYTKI